MRLEKFMEQELNKNIDRLIILEKVTLFSTAISLRFLEQRRLVWNLSLRQLVFQTTKYPVILKMYIQ